MKNIWEELHDSVSGPILIQAPMEDVTDTVFRRIIGMCGKPDLYFTEFTNVDGMFSWGKQKVTQRLQFTESERPLIAQVWGSKPENFYKAARYITELGFDGIDINMGCPEKKVIQKGLCAALIDNHPYAEEIIQATIEGVKSMTGVQLPVSVKTRIGVREICTEEWVRFLLKFDLAAITLHGRTVKEMSHVPAHWDEIGKAVNIRNKLQPGKTTSNSSPNDVDSARRTLIIGNGDVLSRSDANAKAVQFGVDGVMIGRGIFNDIGVFHKKELADRELSRRDRFKLLGKHVSLWQSEWGSKKNFNTLKKYVKIYVKDFPDASQVREHVMNCKTLDDMKEVVMRFEKESK